MTVLLCSGTNDLLKIFWIYEVFFEKNFVSLPAKCEYGETIDHVDMPFGQYAVSDGSDQSACVFDL